jgi:hypothetical protein
MPVLGGDDVQDLPFDGCARGLRVGVAVVAVQRPVVGYVVC